MNQNFRHPEILRIAREDGKVTVEGLAAHFNVTLQTIRRDLTDLAEAGQLARVHGGAVLPSGTSNIRYAERRVLNEVAKTAMAARVAARIPQGASVFLSIGTTTEAVARALAGHRGLMVLTNNLNVAGILVEHPDCDVVLAGGQLRRADGGLTGALTVQSLRAFKVDVAVIGCSALDAEGDLLDFDISEVEAARVSISQARRTILVADHSKFTRSAPARIASLEEVDLLVTDRSLPPGLAERCALWGTEVIVAG